MEIPGRIPDPRPASAASAASSVTLRAGQADVGAFPRLIAAAGTKDARLGGRVVPGAGGTLHCGARRILSSVEESFRFGSRKKSSYWRRMFSFRGDIISLQSRVLLLLLMGG